MTTEDNKTTMRRIFNIANSGDLSALDALIDEHCSYRASSGEEARDLEEFKVMLASYQSAFDGYELSLEELVGDGDKVMGVYRQRGTHSSDLMGIPPSKAEMDLPVFFVATFENGTLLDLYEMFDTLEFVRQLGAITGEEKAFGVRDTERAAEK